VTRARGTVLARGAALALVWLACAGTAHAQPPAAAAAPAAAPQPAPETVGPPAPPAPPAGPTAIPVGEIGVRVDQVRQQIAQMITVAAPDPAIAEIDKQLLAKEHAFDDRMRKAESDLQSEEISLEELDDLALRAAAANDQLATWQDMLSKRSQVLDKNRTELQKIRDTWNLTADQAKSQGAPPELLEAVKSVQKDLRDVDKKLDDAFASVLKLQAVIAEKTLAVSVLVQDVRRVRFEARGRLFARDHPPLWAVFGATETSEPILTRVRDGLERDARNVATFAQLGGGRAVIVHAISLIVFLVIAFRMRRWIASRAREGKAPGPSDAVFHHPILTALMLTVLVTPWVQPYAPRAYIGWIGVLAILPIVVLLPNVLAPTYKSVWYAMAAAFVIDRVRYVFQPAEVVERTLLLLSVLVAIPVAVRLLRKRWYEGLVSPRWRGLFRLALQLSLAALVASAIANVVGYEALADLLGMTVLRSAWSGMLLYASVNVARSLIGALVRSRAAKTLHLVQQRRATIERWIGLLFGIVAGIWWGARVTDLMGLGDPVRQTVRWFFTAPITIGKASFSLGDALLFVLTALAGILLSRLVRVALEEDVFPRTRLARGVPNAISTTARYAILIGAFLLAAAAAGFQWNQVTLLAGAFGVGVGFGLQNIVNNFISGLILLYERPIQVGDTVEVGSLVGEVKRIGIRSSSVRTWQGAEVIVPNGNLISEQVVNWTLSDRNRRIDLPVVVSNTAEPEHVLGILQEVGKGNPDLMDEPAPMAVFLGFGAGVMNFELRVWTMHIDRFVTIRTDLALAVHHALESAGVGILPGPPLAAPSPAKF
jgi:small-conductance mechanosensitive channel